MDLAAGADAAGAALGVAVLSTLAAVRTGRLLAAGRPPATALTGGYHVAFGVGAGLAAAALVLAAAVLRPSATVRRSRSGTPIDAAPGRDHHENDGAVRRPARRPLPNEATSGAKLPVILTSLPVTQLPKPKLCCEDPCRAVELSSSEGSRRPSGERANEERHPADDLDRRRGQRLSAVEGPGGAGVQLDLIRFSVASGTPSRARSVAENAARPLARSARRHWGAMTPRPMHTGNPAEVAPPSATIR